MIVPATVTDDSPLRVQLDGADSDSAATAVGFSTPAFAVSDRVWVEIHAGRVFVVGAFTPASGDVAAHLADTGDAHDASAISFVPAGGVAATDVQAAIVELDSDVVHDTGNETIAGIKTFSSDPIIPDEVYGAGWNGSLEPPTKNAVYDKIETLPTGAMCGVRCLRATSSQTLANSTEASIQWNSETFDTDGFHDNVTNNTRLTVPAGKGGYYRIKSSVYWTGNATGLRDLSIRKNGSAYVLEHRWAAPPGAGAWTQEIDTVVSLAAGDYLEVRATQVSGGNLDVISSASGSTVTSVEMFRVGT